jgi:hypothetical protein
MINIPRQSCPLLIAAALLVVMLADLSFTGTVEKNSAGEKQTEQSEQTAPAPRQDIAQIPVSELAAHKALYEIEMVSRRSATQILNISGQMFFEWHPACEAWSSDHRFDLLYEYAETAPMRITSDFSTYEAIDGRRFHFSSRRSRNGELYEELRGRADSHADKEGAVSYTVPASFSLDLPPGTLFPGGHTRALIAQAKAGEKFFNATIFDGSDEDGPVEINAFFGKEHITAAAIKNRKNVDGSLLGGQAWDIRMAFFPLANDEADSDYEMNLVLYENGIIGDMLVEYRDFSVTQTLVALEKVETPPCH